MSAECSVKSADAACGTKNWMGLSWEEIDRYLEYGKDDSLENKLVKMTSSHKRIARNHIYVLSARRRNNGRIRLRFSGKRTEDLNVRATQGQVSGSLSSCTGHNSFINTNRSRIWIDDWVVNSNIYLRNFVAFGRTSSPLLNYFLGERGPCNVRQIIDDSRDDLMLMIVECVDELRALYTGLVSCKLRLRGFPRLRRLQNRLESFKQVGFLRFVTALSHVALSMSNYTDKVGLYLVLFIYRLERAYAPIDATQSDDVLSGFDVPSTCNGIAVIAPPGTGKTQFLNGFQLGFIDTDWLSTGLLDENPEIVDRILDSGISLITNRWEWRNWKHRPIYIKPYSFDDRIRSKIKPTAEIRALTESKRVVALQQFTDLRTREWRDAYAGIEDHCVTIRLGKEQCLLHGYGVLLDHILTLQFS